MFNGTHGNQHSDLNVPITVLEMVKRSGMVIVTCGAQHVQANLSYIRRCFKIKQNNKKETNNKPTIKHEGTGRTKKYCGDSSKG